MNSIDNCIYKGACTLECDDNCIRFLEMQKLIELSMLPDTLPQALYPEACDKQSFDTLRDIKNAILNFANDGKNLYLYSTNTGNGKTTWATKMLLKYFDSVWAGNGFRARGLFIYVPQFLFRLTDFNNADEELANIKRLIPTVDLVVWDDIGAKKISDYDNSQLLNYIEQRLQNGKSNIFTSNVGGESLNQVLGNRLASRIWKSSVRVELTGRDRRDS